MDNFDIHKAKQYYDELVLIKEENLKLQKIVDEYNKKKESHRAVCLKHSNKLKEILIFCEACQINIKKPSLTNHNRSTTHLNNLNNLKNDIKDNV